MSEEYEEFLNCIGALIVSFILTIVLTALAIAVLLILVGVMEV